MDRVLLLNQSYEPISVIGWQKAVRLLMLEKVEVIKEYDSQLRSRYLTLKMPAVVRLFRAFKRARKRVKFNRANILARDRYACQYCNQFFSSVDLTYDHVIPRSATNFPGTNWYNVVCCCKKCNQTKGNKTPEQAGMKLKKKPTRPDWVPILVGNMSRKVIPAEWREFCYE